MSKIGIFFGTDTGSTRLVAKKMYSLLGNELADKPVNINRVTPADLLSYDALILGTPSYGIGDLPGMSVGCTEPSWAEFVANMGDADFSGKKIALFGLGNQERYAPRFANSLIQLYRVFTGYGADIVGRWSTEGYTFENSDSVVDGEFVGLVLDQRTQPHLSDERLKIWLPQITPLLLPSIAQAAVA